MPYITSIEQIGYDRGIEEEIKRSLDRERSLMLRMMTRKLGSISPDSIQKISTLSFGEIEALSEALFDFNSITDLDRWLSQQK